MVHAVTSTLAVALTAPLPRKHHGLEALHAAQQAADDAYLQRSGALPLVDALVRHACFAATAAPSFSDVDVVGELLVAAQLFQWRAAHPSELQQIERLKECALSQAHATAIATSTRTVAAVDELLVQLEEHRSSLKRLVSVVPPFACTPDVFPANAIGAALDDLGEFCHAVRALLQLRESLEQRVWTTFDIDRLRSECSTLQAQVVALAPLFKSQSGVITAGVKLLHRVVHSAPLVCFLRGPACTPNCWHAALGLPTEEFQHKLAAAVKARSPQSWTMAQLLDFLDDQRAWREVERAMVIADAEALRLADTDATATGPAGKKGHGGEEERAGNEKKKPKAKK